MFYKVVVERTNFPVKLTFVAIKQSRFTHKYDYWEFDINSNAIAKCMNII